jgi:3D (Asp-Asp-Asp) domain-containing protein
MSRIAPAAFAALGVFAACGGSAWMAEPLPPDTPPPIVLPQTPRLRASAVAIDAGAPDAPSDPDEDKDGGPALILRGSKADPAPSGERSERTLGVFRNTYYDLPHERDYRGTNVSLMSAACDPIAAVPRSFYESACVQGSGTLKSGKTVSFARRDCGCAEVCPRTGQRICFELLDARSFPFGRGAAGRPIAPLVTVAADTSVLPLGTAIYVREFDGVARREAPDKRHDGCFRVEDRGVRVVGAHIDVFTGSEADTAFYNRVLPSNTGVTVTVGSPRCAHLLK